MKEREMLVIRNIDAEKTGIEVQTKVNEELVRWKKLSITENSSI